MPAEIRRATIYQICLESFRLDYQNFSEISEKKYTRESCRDSRRLFFLRRSFMQPKCNKAKTESAFDCALATNNHKMPLKRLNHREQKNSVIKCDGTEQQHSQLRRTMMIATLTLYRRFSTPLETKLLVVNRKPRFVVENYETTHLNHNCETFWDPRSERREEEAARIFQGIEHNRGSIYLRRCVTRDFSIDNLHFQLEKNRKSNKHCLSKKNAECYAPYFSEKKQISIKFSSPVRNKY